MKSRWYFGLAALLFLIGAGPSHGGAYDAWLFRMKIRVASYDKPEILTNFPTLVVLSTNIPNFRYTDFNSSSNGADLRFAASNETTELNYEIEKWNTNGSSYVWVQVPTISSTNDFIYAYWGSNDGVAPCTTNGTTWTNGFQGVWHLDEASGNALDSTTNHYSGAVTVAARGATGKVASGYQFDGSGNYININMTLGATATISTWASKAAGAQMLWVVHGDSPGPDLWFPDGSIYLNSWDGNANRFCAEPANVDQLHHYVTVIDSVRNLSQLYIDGILAATASYRTPAGASTFSISKVGSDYDWAGVIDEFSISSVVRSSNWVYACWLNQASNNAFIAFSDTGRVSTNLSVRANSVNGIGITSATMSGTILNVGGAENPNVYICWGYADGGTNSTSNWAHVESLGANWGTGQSFSTNITGLLLGSNYSYRCYVTNSTGEDWSDTAIAFRTIYLPSVTNSGATAVGGYSATLNGAITDLGNETPFVWAYYWPASGATTVVAAATQSGAFNTFLSGLQNGITYTYQWCASNAAGVVLSSNQSFTTAAQSRTWVGTSSDWFTDSNWSPAGVPQAQDTVTIPSAAASPLITHSPAPLISLTITSGTLSCSNWNTVITATDITIQNSGKITMPGPFASTAMSNRVYIVCSNLTVTAGGQIDTSERGYAVGSGPGKGTGTDLVGGAGHGGKGGYAQGRGNIPNEVGGPVYGSETEPNEPGSSTTVGWAGNQSGKGGGVIRIEASGTVTINGTLNANAGNATESHAGGGSGGSIYINCQNFQGSVSGQIMAKGGDAGLYGDSWNGGGGGGGRIAVIYQTCNLPSVNFSVTPGFSYFTDGGNTYGSEMGTLYLSTAEALTPLLSTLSGRLIAPGLSSWSPASLIISNCAIGLGTNFQLNVGGDLTVTGATAQLRMGFNSTLASSGNLQMNGGKILLETNSTVTCNAGTLNGGVLVVKGNFSCATDLTLTNGALFYVYSGPTNITTDYGSLVRIDHMLSVAPSSWVYPYSEPVSGGSPLFQMPYLMIASNAGFNAIGTGYGIGQGPGSRSAGDRGTGASHGGKGGMGDQRDVPGPIYGSSNAPTMAGSGANYSYMGGNKGFGGGVIRLEVANLLSLNGTIDASGGTHLGGSQHGGGGAGGSIFIIAGRFDSAAGSVLNAKGGTAGVINNSQNGGGGGGGGGRIAVWVGYSPDSVTRYVTTGFGSRPEIFDKFLGSTSVTNGLGYYNGAPDGAEPGTIQLLWSPGQGTVFTIR